MKIEETDKEMIIRILKEKDYTLSELKQLLINRAYLMLKEDNKVDTELIKLALER